MGQKTLAEWLSWQERLHPKRIELRLERLERVWQNMGPPRLHGPVITVGGTNGKGSTVAYLEACCRASGFSTGAYTSPHLLRYNERVRIDGRDATDEQLCAAFERIDRARAEIPLTYFEFGTLAALEIFSRSRVQILLLEVGLGGRLDAVNLLDADIAVVTSIGRDHMAWLGEDPNQIAFEKAGIFRAGRPAIIGSRQPPPRLRERAEQIGAEVLQLGREFDWAVLDPGPSAGIWQWRHADGTLMDALPLPALSGTVQLDNASAALAALHRLPSSREWALDVSSDALRTGLRAVSLAGRFQVVAGDPLWIFDVAHNRDAVAVLVENLRNLCISGRIHVVFGVLADKEARAIAERLSAVAHAWYLAEPAAERAMPLEQLAAEVSAAGVQATRLCDTLEQAMDLAQSAACPGDAVLITGSFTTVEAGLRRRLGYRE